MGTTFILLLLNVSGVMNQTAVWNAQCYITHSHSKSASDNDKTSVDAQHTAVVPTNPALLT